MQEQRRILRSPQRQGLSISHGTLKIIGLICTAAGAWASVQYAADEISTGRMMLMLLSYVALPIYAFLTVEGVSHTSDFGRYVVRTLIAAVVAEPFYDYARQGTLFYFIGENAQNVLFSILVAQVMLYYLMRVKAVKAWGFALKAVLVLAALFWAALLQGQYGAAVILMSVICYLFKDKKFIRGMCIILLSIATYFSPVVAVFFINRYDGEAPKYNKYFFYAAFVFLWMALAMMRIAGI